VPLEAAARGADTVETPFSPMRDRPTQENMNRARTLQLQREGAQHVGHRPSSFLIDGRGNRPRQLLTRINAAVKALVGWFLFRSGIYRMLWRRRAVIVVFHRVNDAIHNDPITCTTTQFERFVRFFARFFEVISLGELLRRLESGEVLPPSLTITFDDGYRGNATIAAPILERHGLRACFFVTTGFIGSDHVPEWDRELGIKTMWMSWDQVRALRAAGHEIGSHTATHIDMGTTPPDRAREEIVTANDRLERELGQASGLFAYPFGAQANMSAANQEMLRASGLRCSLSAYGGTVRAGDDLLKLRRVNISDWFRSPYQFGFELIAGRLEQD
jgi:peptidoglycan/xylan/chitin deacetylase (PgdA/CDA1 family)